MGDITVEEEAETRFIADSSKGAKTEATGKATFSCGTPAVSDGTATSFLTDETLVDAGGTTTLTAGTQVVADEKAWLFTGGRSLTVGLDRTTFLGGSNVTGSSSNPYKFTKDGLPCSDIDSEGLLRGEMSLVQLLFLVVCPISLHDCFLVDNCLVECCFAFGDGYLEIFRGL